MTKTEEDPRGTPAEGPEKPRTYTPAMRPPRRRGGGDPGVAARSVDAAAARAAAPAGAQAVPAAAQAAAPAQAAPAGQKRSPRAPAPVPPRIGGIALQNGLALVSDRFWAAAIREADGSISVASGRKPRLPGTGEAAPAACGPGAPGARAGGPGAAASRERGATPAPAGVAAAPGASRGRGRTRGGLSEGIPLLRGLGRFGESLLVLAQVKMRLPRAELPLEGTRVLGALAGSMAATSAVHNFAPKSALVQETGAALAAFIPAVLSLKNSQISAYHGAEHKIIGGLEAAEARAGGTGAAGGAGAARRTAADGAAAAKEHDRCGSNLVGPLLLATVATNLLVRGRRGGRTPAATALAGAVSLGAALEALRWATRHGDNLAARLLLAPGRALQKRLTTTEPTPEQLEVAERAMAELLRLERAST